MNKQHTVEQLQQMEPFEVAMAFKESGGWRATVRSFCRQPCALEEWKTAHPEFTDPKVSSLLQSGQTQIYIKTIEEVSQALVGTDLTVTVLGLGDHHQMVEIGVAGSLPRR